MQANEVLALVGQIGIGIALLGVVVLLLSNVYSAVLRGQPPKTCHICGAPALDKGRHGAHRWIVYTCGQRWHSKTGWSTAMVCQRGKEQRET